MSHRLDCKVLEELELFAAGVAARLQKEPCEVNYPDGCDTQNWPVEAIRHKVGATFRKAKDCGNIYGIFVREAKNWEFRYVGKSQPASLGKRLHEHFIGPKPSAQSPPNSKHEKVKQAVSEGKRVGFSYVDVRPRELNVFVEVWIQRNCKPEWNDRTE